MAVLEATTGVPDPVSNLKSRNNFGFLFQFKCELIYADQFESDRGPMAIDLYNKTWNSFSDSGYMLPHFR